MRKEFSKKATIRNLDRKLAFSHEAEHTISIYGSDYALTPKQYEECFQEIPFEDLKEFRAIQQEFSDRALVDVAWASVGHICQREQSFKAVGVLGLGGLTLWAGDFLAMGGGLMALSGAVAGISGWLLAKRAARPIRENLSITFEFQEIADERIALPSGTQVENWHRNKMFIDRYENALSSIGNVVQKTDTFHDEFALLNKHAQGAIIILNNTTLSFAEKDIQVISLQLEELQNLAERYQYCSTISEHVEASNPQQTAEIKIKLEGMFKTVTNGIEQAAKNALDTLQKDLNVDIEVSEDVAGQYARAMGYQEKQPPLALEHLESSTVLDMQIPAASPDAVTVANDDQQLVPDFLKKTFQP